MAADLAIAYLREMDSNTGTLSGTIDRNMSVTDLKMQVPAGSAPSAPVWRQEKIGELIETAIQRVPIYYIKQKSVDKGVNMYRNLLHRIDRKSAQNIQLCLARQLAEVLLRGVPEATYHQPTSTPAASAGDAASQEHSSHHLQVQVARGGFGQTQKSPLFVPTNRTEELLLLLSLGDSIACRDAVISRSSEADDVRRLSVHQVKAVHNLLTLVLSHLRQYHLLSDVWERALKFAYGDIYIWFSFGLSLLCQGRANRSLSVLQECEKMQSKDPVVFLMIAKINVESLTQPDEGIAYAQRALDLCQGGWLSSRAYLLLGLGHSQKGEFTKSYPDRKMEEAKALEYFQQATRLDPKDSTSWFYLALQHAISRDLEAAAEACHEALSQNCENSSALLLLALIMTARHDYVEALEIVEEAMGVNPNHYGLIILRMKLEVTLGISSMALESAKDLLLFWKRTNFYLPEQVHVKMPDEGSTRDGPVSGTGISVTPMSELDKESIAASFHPTSEYGVAPSTVSDSMGLTASTHQRNAAAAWRLQANIWLELGELLIDLGRVQEVELCVDEAVACFPSSHQSLYLRGRVHAAMDRYPEAKASFLAALSLYPNYLPALRQLAATYAAEGNYFMAEKILRDTIQAHPLDRESWQLLGDVMVMGAKTGSEDCFRTAIELDLVTPLVSFSSFARTIDL